jgi:hypothetical protein
MKTLHLECPEFFYSWTRCHTQRTPVTMETPNSVLHLMQVCNAEAVFALAWGCTLPIRAAGSGPLWPHPDSFNTISHKETEEE